MKSFQYTKILHKWIGGNRKKPLDMHIDSELKVSEIWQWYLNQSQSNPECFKSIALLINFGTTKLTMNFSLKLANRLLIWIFLSRFLNYKLIVCTRDGWE